MKLLGTDGVRGKYGEKITNELAYNLGLSVGKIMNQEGIKKMYVGQDPRESSKVLEEK